MIDGNPCAENQRAGPGGERGIDRRKTSGAEKIRIRHVRGNPIISPERSREDTAADNTLRPRKLADYQGQAAVHEQMDIFIRAARQRGESLDHVLIFGPPGRAGSAAWTGAKLRAQRSDA